VRVDAGHFRQPGEIETMNEKDPDPQMISQSQEGPGPDFDERDVPLRQFLRLIWNNFPWLLKRAVAVVLTLTVLMALVTAAAGIYTSRPEFCRSCHNMEPYYVSWQHSSHNDVTCIKCHFPPGAGEKIRGKLLGLVQLAKYVTRSEGPRPVAEIPDASCLRSGCHETRLLSGRVDFHGVSFDHRPHLEELRRGKKLRCTSCHGQIVQGTHMTVTVTTCFLCHFKDNFFNEGLGTCTRCHQIPDKDFDLGGGIHFNHDLAYDRGVDCENCHSDLIRGNGEVPHERCGVCHNRESDLEKITDHEFMHKLHVSDHKVDCLACHLEITHQLDDNRLANAAADCTSCHPGHHQEQVSMLMGVGAESIPSQKNGMVSARITCVTCHRFKQVSPTGTVLWKASTESCNDCHDESQAEMIKESQRSLVESLDAIESAVDRIRTAVPDADLDADKVQEIEEVLRQAQDDLNFLRVGNGIHNVHYATTVNRTVLERLSLICRQLEIPEPDVTLPEKAETE
jgi:nitrate/TMAO reductase-like tetraheme cytochrome c subunit